MEIDPRHIAYLKRWETLGPELERLRAEEIRNADTQAAMRAFSRAFIAARRDLPERTTSGLVEWGRLINKWRERG